jgi:LysM repeat protein
MPKDPHITGGIRHDWAAIKHDYVTDTEASLRKIAAKYGVNYNTIAHRSKAEGWFATRKEHQAKVVSKAISQTGTKQARELSRELDFLNTMQDRMSEMLADADQFKRHIVIDNLESKEVVAEKYDTHAMKDTFQMLEIMEKLSRSLLDIQRLEAMQKHEIDVQRMQLEREKFEFEKQKAAAFKPAEGNAIRIEGFEEGWAD